MTRDTVGKMGRWEGGEGRSEEERKESGEEEGVRRRGRSEEERKE